VGELEVDVAIESTGRSGVFRERRSRRAGRILAYRGVVIDGIQVKVFAWYENEWDYSNWLVELAENVLHSTAYVHLRCEAETTSL
jgi:glyceraldehyde-3-phosphate dehydrogenase/erythrose-4-phosphate dehydrogenase